MKPAIIYALVDPRLHLVRYIGKTCKTVDVRLSEHLWTARKDGKTYRDRWIRTLLKDNLKPFAITVEVIENSSDWQSRERFWIATLRALNGSLLTNISDGGDGVCMPHTPEWNEHIAAAQRGKKRQPLSAEHRAKISLGNIGHSRVITPEHREKLRLANLGKKNGPPSIETRLKIGAAHRGKTQPPYTDEQHQRLLASVKRGQEHHQAKLTEQDVIAIRELPAGGNQIASLYGVSYTTIKRIRSRKIWKHI